jgi:hypothetical protein
MNKFLFVHLMEIGVSEIAIAKIGKLFIYFLCTLGKMIFILILITKFAIKKLRTQTRNKII